MNSVIFFVYFWVILLPADRSSYSPPDNLHQNSSFLMQIPIQITSSYTIQISPFVIQISSILIQSHQFFNENRYQIPKRALLRVACRKYHWFLAHNSSFSIQIHDISPPFRLPMKPAIAITLPNASVSVQNPWFLVKDPSILVQNRSFWA